MIEAIPKQLLIIPENRQRKERDPTHIVDLANSIESSGLIHPITIRRDEIGRPLLVAGECRTEAIDYLWNMGVSKIRCAGKEFFEGFFPCIDLKNINSIDAYEIELEENIRRKDLSWQDKAAATSQLFELRTLQAQKRGSAPPTVAQVAEEIRGTGATAHNRTRKELIVSRYMGDSEVKKAKTVDEAFKLIKRKEQIQRSVELGRTVGATFSSRDHSLIKGDCLAVMKLLPDASFDVILTDPPYGIDAQDYNDSGGKTAGGHFYDDSYETWLSLMEVFSVESFRIAKPQAHAYVFCDVDNFQRLKLFFEDAGWKPFRTPLIAVNPTSMRAPWPDQGPQRKWQMILYAVKGSKHVNHLRPDVLTYPSDLNLNHHAQKPVALYADLLTRSCVPGDSVIDPFCGTGTIFAAAHDLKVKATGIEMDEGAYGIATERLKKLV